MPLTDYFIIDVATAPLENAADFIDVAGIQAPSNYKDVLKIEAYKAETAAQRIASAALDLDLCRISAIGTWVAGGEPQVRLCQNGDSEAVCWVQSLLSATDGVCIGYNSLKFDLPVVMRRSLYLDLPMPDVNLDRYRTPHVDLWQKLSLNGTLTAHSLSWYAKRLGWTDLVKPLSGADEAQVFTSGRWDELKASVLHDLEATRRLAQKMGVL